MLKVTIKFTAVVFFLIAGCCVALSACKMGTNREQEDESVQKKDSISEARIDSAYLAINNACDTALLHIVPRLTDSLLRGDSIYLKTFFDSVALYTDADKKVEKVVRQLKADCDSNLLKETYKRVRLLQRPKPRLHKKAKA